MVRGNPFRSTRRLRRVGERRRTLTRPLELLLFFRRPEHIRAVVLLVVFALLGSALVGWSRRQVLVLDGQIMTETRVWRLDYSYEDVQATEALRAEERKRSPALYRYTAQEDTLRDEIMGLPSALAGKARADIDFKIIPFELDEAALAVLQSYAQDPQRAWQWHQVTERLFEQLRLHPLLTSADAQVFALNRNRARAVPGGEPVPLLARMTPIELSPESPERVRAQLEETVREAAVPEALVGTIAARLHDQPTIEYLPRETEELASAAASRIQPVIIARNRGDVLYARGDALTAQQYAEVNDEAERHAASLRGSAAWIPRLGSAGLSLVITLLLGVVVGPGYPRLMRNAWRLAALGAFLLAMLALSATIARHAPAILYAAAMGPTLFVAVVVLLAYDQRLAAVLAALQSALVALALQQNMGWFLLTLAGCGAMIVQLREVRHRNSLIRAATATAALLGVGSVCLGLLEVPLVEGAWRQIVANAGWAAAGAFAVGFVVLGILPSIERLFGITTGMTLAELRDPRQPLLRQLQQRAPGTYNHSLQVANIGEAAAEAIGADGLLVYVAALYHDIGKVNKPEYFVENVAHGDSKHDKLSPAMSLLVIIGHVKDGIELAREYGLPRPIIHTIESHHGTTLVEYFYHAAKEQAEGEERVAEVEFRYPGPKPRTREAAIVMLADAVESATRALVEPNPSRIEAIVRQLSRKRLTDGQFDQCPLTFRDLGLIEEAMIGRLCAIHHGRISYPRPGGEGEEATDTVRSVPA